jgi:hypothetical protein
VVSGNGGVGIQVLGRSATWNQIAGNLVGTDASGLNALGNGTDGVFIQGAPESTIGGSEQGARNVISGNAQVGIQFSGRGASGNLVQGNDVGTDVNGQPRLGNHVGLFLGGTTRNNASATDNLIAGNSVDVLKTAGPTPHASRAQGPTVAQVALVSDGTQVRSIVVTFNGAVDVNRAQDISNYRLRLPARGGRSGMADAVPIPLSAAAYNSATNSVTLTLVSPLSASAKFQVRISARPNRGIMDPNGDYLHGRSDGGVGDYVATVGPAASGTSGQS